MDDDTAPTTRFPPTVEPTRPRPRIAVAAAPRLLADSLSILLSRLDADVVLVLEPDTTPFDLVLTTTDGPTVAAPVRVLLENGPSGTACGQVLDWTNTRIDTLMGLPAMIDYVERWCGDHRLIARDGG